MAGTWLDRVPQSFGCRSLVQAEGEECSDGELPHQRHDPGIRKGGEALLVCQFRLDGQLTRSQVIEIPEGIITLALNGKKPGKIKTGSGLMSDEIEKSGYSVEDTSEGPKLSK